MSAVGPELPPHLLAKRKRQQEEEDKDEATAAPGAKRAKSPPPQQAPRQVGPAPPPAPLDQRPLHPPNTTEGSDSSDDEDDFGPALPSAGDQTAAKVTQRTDDAHSASVKQSAAAAPISKRDDWMTMPPTQDDLAARLDPSKPRARGFNTGKGARGPSAPGDNSIWTETPEQKRKRLEDQVMGTKSEAPTDNKESEAQIRARREEDRERAAKIKAERGRSLYDLHQKTQGVEEDDPSRRTFDREKDIGSGMPVSEKKRKEMLSKASGFNAKFSSGSFL